MNTRVEAHIERTIKDAIGDKAVRVFRHVKKLAAKQGGESALENYQLLGKRTLIVFGVALVTVNAAVSAVSFIASRKSERKRVEAIVRQVMEEEKQKEAADQA